VNSPVPSVTPTAVGEIKGESGKPQTVDIISGKPIVRSVYGDYDGERLYFCCGESRKAFEANRQVYLQKIREKGIILEKTP
jgi:YHS domain-containing protein